MKIPKTLKIGAYTFRVKPCELDGKFGDCDHTKHIIRIDPQYSKIQQEDTLIHEILHAVRHQLQIENSDEDREERTVTALATMLYGVLRDNKLLK